MIVHSTYAATRPLATGPSPAYCEGRNDAAAGEPMPAGCSPAYAMGYNDFTDEQRAAG